MLLVSLETHFVSQSQTSCRKRTLSSLAIATVNLSRYTRQYKVRLISSFLMGCAPVTSKVFAMQKMLNILLFCN